LLAVDLFSQPVHSNDKAVAVRVVRGNLASEVHITLPVVEQTIRLSDSPGKCAIIIDPFTCKYFASSETACSLIINVLHMRIEMSAYNVACIALSMACVQVDLSRVNLLCSVTWEYPA
jgi:hypothetical protein